MDDQLTHGWEPDLTPDDSLVRRYLLSNAERTAAMAGRVGGRSARWDDAAAADPASPFLFDNLAILLQPPAYVDVGDLMRRLFAFYPPDRHVAVLSAWPTPDLSGYGLELMGHPPFMLRAAGGVAPPLPAGLRIDVVRDRDELRLFLRTLIEAYPMPGVPVEGVEEAWQADDLRLFVGYLDGRPVATAGARLGHGIVDVEWVSAMPAHRGRGIGAALTWAATMAEPEQPAVLIASDPGQPVYEAMGYLRLFRMTMWQRLPG